MQEPGRYRARVINIGDIPLGGDHPVRVQSMTNTDTLDTASTVRQVIELIEAGSEFVRLATPSVKSAENLASIKKALTNKGYNNPLIADIHFNPKAAEAAARLVEKIRINPGNYTGMNIRPKADYSEKEYNLELEHISERLYPLLKICKEYGTVIRIGTNHGSLSGRILSRFGNTAEGMVVSELEYLRICEQFSFRDIVVSLKSSNIRVMIEAYKMLAGQMISEGMDYPLHLGVTEAGDAEDGIIKSSAGIGTLLQDGIGDTIRVSLTGNPVDELPVARLLCDNFSFRNIDPLIREKKIRNKGEEKIYHTQPRIAPAAQFPVVISGKFNRKADFFFENGRLLNPAGESFHTGETILLIDWKEGITHDEISSYISRLEKPDMSLPLIVKRTYNNISYQELLVRSATDYARFFLEGRCNGIWIDTCGSVSNEKEVQTSFDILQVMGKRISRTDFIACPSCGRTLFDIEKTLARVKAATSHLKGLKIAVMGCIVNGPGEMADADYGYVGHGRGKISLYKGNIELKSSIPEAEAVEELINLIKENDQWVEPEKS